MVRAEVLLLGVLACLCVSHAVHMGKPRTEHSQSLIQQGDEAEADEGQTNDEAVVTQNFGGTTVNMENLKNFIRRRGVSDVGVFGDLLARAACVIRLEGDMGGDISTTSLQEYLTGRQLSTAGSKDDLLDRACDYQSKELIVREKFGKSLGDITKEELKSELASMGFFSTSGEKPELVARLGKAIRDINTIKKLLGDESFDPANTKSLLEARNLSTDGPMSGLLTRLADYLVDQSDRATMPGVSPHCDMIAESGLCFGGGEKVLVPDAAPRGLVGKWTFDDQHMLDHSGHANHAKEAIPFGPGLNGIGHSAKFDGTNFLVLPHSDEMNSQDFCMTMWMYLLTDSNGQWRTLVHKGSRDNERTPMLMLEPLTRGIEFFVSTTDDSQPAGERLWSNTFVPLRRWTHIAACAEGRNLRLYVNGILDAENATIGSPIYNKGDIHVGNDPWRPGGGMAGYVDDFRYYARSLTSDEIQAQAQVALGMVEPSFVELGCMMCSIDNCPKACRKGYRMCTQRDLNSGAYFVSRLMGWASHDTHIWRSEDGKAEKSDTLTGLCMCCRISGD